MNVLRGSVPLTAACCLVSALFLLGAAVPAAASFQAADLVIIPVASYTEGLEGSQWGTDVVITNVDTVAIDVAVYLMPAGPTNNYSYYNRQTNGLGGRSEELFKYVDERLADIPPMGSVVLEQPLALWYEEIGTLASRGTLVVFAYTAGSLDDRDSFPDGAEPRNVLANARIYNQTTILIEDPDNEGEQIEKDVTYGQTMPGVPWYNLADGGYPELATLYLQGAAHTEDTRFNYGIFNASDPLTTITVLTEVLQADGEPFVDTDGDPIASLDVLGPLTQFQRSDYLAGKGIEIGSKGVLLKIRLIGWSTGSANPRPMFTVYGSLIDDSANDATTLLPFFPISYDVDCMWQNDSSTARKLWPGDREQPLTAP